MRKMTRNKLSFVFLLVLTMGLMLTGCGEGNAGSSGAADGNSMAVSEGEKETMTNEKTVIEITMENGGVISIELDPEAAPVSVENFLKLVDEGFYDGLTFHRIIPNFMIQGGDPEGTGMGGSDEKIKGEFSSNGWENPISHERGVISMARSQNHDSASSQFFITNADASFLDGDYAAFGRVLSGMDVVDEITAVETNANDAPTTAVVIETIRRAG